MKWPNQLGQVTRLVNPITGLPATLTCRPAEFSGVASIGRFAFRHHSAAKRFAGLHAKVDHQLVSPVLCFSIR